MKQPSIESSRLMPAANSTGNVRIAYHGSANAARAAGEDQQADLGRGVEAEPEQQADRVHVPGLGHRLGETAEERFMKPRLLRCSSSVSSS